ncbi:hypothetical protein [Vibrio mediterranei]|uniref:hypothetical protein n=1 Tax=Vibrio mediterranei TaxID=689 RepID=UPI004068E996
MVNPEFAGNEQLRFHQTESLPLILNNPDLFFVVIDEQQTPYSFNCDTRSLNNLHRCLVRMDDADQALVMCSWHGYRQSHLFICDTDVLETKIKEALGNDFCDELESNLAI